MVRSRQFIEPGLGVTTYLDFGAILFSTQWPPYGAHILQGLFTKLYSTEMLVEFLQKHGTWYFTSPIIFKSVT